MNRTTGLIAATCVLALAFGTPALSAESVDGKAVFEAQKCNLCHSVPTQDIEAKTSSEKMKGPDLVNLAEDYEAEWIAKFLTKQADKDGKKHSKKFGGSDDELKALVDWLLEQKSE